MLKLFRDRKGFTLVELMIVVVIVGVLAAVAVPMYRGAVKKARATEAEAALGTIRSALRVKYAEDGSYPASPADSLVWNISDIGIDSTDMIGKFFAAADYKYDNRSATAFYVIATGSGSDVSDIIRTIDQDGDITNTAAPAP